MNYKKLLLISIIILFFLTFWNNIFLPIIFLPIIYFVHNNSKNAMILAGIYSIFLTLVNIALYIEGHRNEQGQFSSSLIPVFIYLFLLINIMVFLKKSYIIEKQKI